MDDRAIGTADRARFPFPIPQFKDESLDFSYSGIKAGAIRLARELKIGDAEMSISVHVLFFGGTVGFSVHEEFAGSSPPAAPNGARRAIAAPLADSPPPPRDFGSYLTPQDWAEYDSVMAGLRRTAAPRPALAKRVAESPPAARCHRMSHRVSDK